MLSQHKEKHTNTDAHKNICACDLMLQLLLHAEPLLACDFYRNFEHNHSTAVSSADLLFTHFV